MHQRSKLLAPGFGFDTGPLAEQSRSFRPQAARRPTRFRRFQHPMQAAAQQGRAQHPQGHLWPAAASELLCRSTPAPSSAILRSIAGLCPEGTLRRFHPRTLLGRPTGTERFRPAQCRQTYRDQVGRHGSNRFEQIASIAWSRLPCRCGHRE